MQFAKIIETKTTVRASDAGTLQDIIFQHLPHRSEKAIVLRACIREEPLQFSLSQFRFIVYALMKRIADEGFCSGDTVMLLSATATNELYTALWFAAFVASGVRVLLPLFPEEKEFAHWVKEATVKAVFMPLAEIRSLEENERLKITAKNIESLCCKNNILLYDQTDWGLPEQLTNARKTDIPFNKKELLLPHVTPEQEAVIFTTSGTTGVTRLVTYTQGAFYKNCLHWQEAGLYKAELCGNACFTPLLTHTIGVRSMVNALWTGNPLCLITVDWFHQKPELARYLLLKMKPAHIVGGPALFNTLLELYRQFPELKQELKPSLKCLISIGAPYSLQTAMALKTVTGLELYNAYGTTETQLVSISLGVNGSNKTLGRPLPGVVFALKATSKQALYELFVTAPYQSVAANRDAEKSFVATGDMVTLDPGTNTLVYAHRSGTDFIKDGFGVKIPLALLKTCYENVYSLAAYIEWLPLDNQPGLAALLFLSEASKEVSLRQLAALFKNSNEQLQATLEPLEFAHWHVERFSVISEPLPCSRKGSFSRGEMLKRYEQLIADLKNPFVRRESIEVLEDAGKSRFSKYMNPQLAELLAALKMDVTYSKGKKDFLFYTKEGHSKKVLDLVGGFGANLLGHNHPELQKIVTAFIRSNRVALNNQGSLHHFPSLLAQKLNELFAPATGKFFNVQLASSGAEAVEMALHHAYEEWLHKLEKCRDRQLQLYGAVAGIHAASVWEENMQVAQRSSPAIIVLQNGFHGYTSGARSLLQAKERRTRFAGLLKPVPLYVDDRQADWKKVIDCFVNSHTTNLRFIVKEGENYVMKEQRLSCVIAAVVEPVTGEGGIRVVNRAVADHLAKQDFPLISDEIQCGLGRTGAVPAYPHADYYLLGKSLGGGYEKIAAVLIDHNRFRTNFPKHYASTFANGELAALVAIKTLELIGSENLPQKAKRIGDSFLKALNRIAEKYPHVIESVQGEGLMIGIHFNSQVGRNNNLLRILFEHELAGYLFSAWFFHRHSIRIFPSLAAPACLRIEPSFFITKKSMKAFCAALEELCVLCSEQKLQPLLSFLMNNDPYDDVKPVAWKGSFPQMLEEPAPGAVRVGFVSNFTNPASELKVIEPDLNKTSETGLRILFSKLQVLLEGKPVKIVAKNLLGGKVHFTFYLLPFDTAFLESVSRWGRKRYFIAKIQEAVDKLAEEGATHISLGAYASILSGNGLALAAKNGVKIITGNTLTIASCLFHLDQCLALGKKAAAEEEQICIAVVGASGNIGSGLVRCLADEKYKRCSFIFIGSNRRRLQTLQEEQQQFEGRTVLCTDDLFSLQNADVVICCTNTNDPILFPHHLSVEKTVFVIDIAVPPALSAEAANLPNVTVCKKASAVSLPQNPELQISSHTEEGKIFCCAGEVLLDALYKTEHALNGHIDPEEVKTLYQLAQKEGFFEQHESSV